MFDQNNRWLKMKKMNVAVLGLGMEGKNAVKALIDYGNRVYASDLDKNLVIKESDRNNLDIELGNHNMEKIDSSDAVVVSPGLWGLDITKNLIKEKKLLSDILTDHRSVFTVGVTGTNGKTTTCYMIKEILENSGFNVLLGGNAGGGFDGYTKLVLDANTKSYDIMVVEVCDMTLEFASYVFDFDIVVVTNLGNDHMSYHGSMEGYAGSICRFLKNKKEAVLNSNDKFLSKYSKCADKTFFFGSEYRKLKLFGKFNLENASAASKVAELLKISSENIEKVLMEFKGVEGRTTVIDLDGSKVIVGKTDNPDAAAAVFKEIDIEVMMIGTPRRTEPWRFSILKEVKNANPSHVVLFPGLDNTTDIAKDLLIEEEFNGSISIIDKVPDIVLSAVDFAKENKSIFIGGNGQKRIVEIQEALMKYAKSNSLN